MFSCRWRFFIWYAYAFGMSICLVFIWVYLKQMKNDDLFISVLYNDICIQGRIRLTVVSRSGVQQWLLMINNRWCLLILLVMVIHFEYVLLWSSIGWAKEWKRNNKQSQQRQHTTTTTQRGYLQIVKVVTILGMETKMMWRSPWWNMNWWHTIWGWHDAKQIIRNT